MSTAAAAGSQQTFNIEEISNTKNVPLSKYSFYFTGVDKYYISQKEKHNLGHFLIGYGLSWIKKPLMFRYKGH